jgi:hypothetical protein
MKKKNKHHPHSHYIMKTLRAVESLLSSNNYCRYRDLYAVFGWSILIVAVCWKNENKLVNLPFSLS